MNSCGSETDKKLSQLRTAIAAQKETAAAHEKSLQSMQSTLLKLKSDAEVQQQKHEDSQQSATSVDDSRPSNSSGKARRQRSFNRYSPVGSSGRDIVLQTTGSTAYAVLSATDLIGKDLAIYWVCILRWLADDALQLLATILIGRLCTYSQDGDDKWYNGKVVGYDIEKDHFNVNYDDGSVVRETLVRPPTCAPHVGCMTAQAKF